MKKWVFLFVIALLFLGYRGFHLLTGSGEAARAGRHAQAETAAGEERQAIRVEADQVYKGDLLLVNKDYPLHPEGVKTDVVDLSENPQLVQGYGLLDNSIQLSKRVTLAFINMIEAANRDNVNHFMMNSGYRSFEEQRQLYAEMGAEYALPEGYSEHNLGVSLDIGSTQTKMEQAPEGKWLQKHAWQYGFILRYPQDKADITGINYEPWHYRYVGLPHSAIMYKRKLTLEQYLDELRDKQELTADVDGKTYQIVYYPAAQTDAVFVPTDRRYEISGDNREGIIVTIEP